MPWRTVTLIARTRDEARGFALEHLANAHDLLRETLACLPE